MVQGNESRVGTKQSEESVGVERVAQVVAAGWTLAFLAKAPIQVHRGERATAAMEMSSCALVGGVSAADLGGNCFL